MERSEQRRIVEALVVGAPEPLPAAQVAQIVPGLSAAEVSACIEELNAHYETEGHAFEIWEVAGGYQLRTRSVYAGYLQQLLRERTLRLSRPALETLAVVAYKQPATRAEIEHVRGVDVGAVLRSLVERRLVRIAGHREVPGRPLLYATTRRFLEVFGLASLEDLPTLRELQELVPAEVMPAPGSAPAASSAAADTPEPESAPGEGAEAEPEAPDDEDELEDLEELLH
jgi:segregation and condensation protein B